MFFYIIKEKIGREEIQNEPGFSPIHPDQYLKSEKTESEIQVEIFYWENIIEKQPNSRDALVNLSILKRTLLDNQEAEGLWNRAKIIDPNNQIFEN